MPIDDHDLGPFPDPTPPGDGDGNTSLTQLVSRVQAWTGSAWRRVRIGLSSAVDSIAVVQATDVSTTTADQESGSYPEPTAVRGAPTSAAIDAFGNLRTRSTILTDEESIRDDFKGASLLTALTGTVDFTNGLATITGTGTAFTTELSNQIHVRAAAHANSVLARVDEIVSDTEAVLAAPYAGATALAAAAISSGWLIATPAGGSITVGSSLVNLIQSTGGGDIISISREGDFLPFILPFWATVSQRIANQEIVVGFVDSIATPEQQAVIVLDGTDPTRGILRTSNGSAADDTESTGFMYPVGLDSSRVIAYEIDVSPNEVTLRINGTVVATNTKHLPDHYKVLSIAAFIENTGVPASATTLSLDSISFQNLDEVNIVRAGPAQPLPVRVAPPVVPDRTRGVIYGNVALAAITVAAVRKTTYTEPAANFTGSVVSASANDAAAGTGARTISIVYYDQDGRGPFVEAATMNGVVAVPLVAADKCFIERIEVNTVGSGLVSAGIITLRDDAVATVGTIAAGDNQTFWTHHYVAAGKTAYVLDVYIHGTSTAANSGSSATLRAKPIGVANAAERFLSDSINVGGGATGAARLYPSQVPVAGPARIVAYVTTLSGGAQTYHCSMTVAEH